MSNFSTIDTTAAITIITAVIIIVFIRPDYSFCRRSQTGGLVRYCSPATRWDFLFSVKSMWFTPAPCIRVHAVILRHKDTITTRNWNNPVK